MRVPRLTIGITTYNVATYLPGALDSILAQDYTDFEVLVCDNRSTDGTWEILARYAERDTRIRLVRNEENLGVAANFNRVVSLTRTELFRHAAHDDLMAPSLLRRCVAALDADPRAVLAYPRTIIIDGDGREAGRWPGDPSITDPSPARRIARYVREWSLCNEVFGVIRTDALRHARPMGLDVAADKRLMLELLQRGTFALVDEPLFYRRIHAESTSGEAHEDTYRWLEPKKARAGAAPARDDHRVATLPALRALLSGEQPLPTRVGSAAAFTAAWTARRAQVALDRRWRRLTGRPVPPPPWEAPEAVALVNA